MSGKIDETAASLELSKQGTEMSRKLKLNGIVDESLLANTEKLSIDL